MNAFLNEYLWLVIYFCNSHVVNFRAVHGLVWVGFVSNPQLTLSYRVEKFQTCRRPRKAMGRVGSSSGGRRSALISTEIQRSNTSLIPEEKNQQIYNPKRISTNPKNRSTNPNNKNLKNRSTNPQINEPKRWNRLTKSERWRQRQAGMLRMKSEGRRRRAQIDDGEAKSTTSRISDE